MKRLLLIVMALAAALCAPAAVAQGRAPDAANWRALDPENTLYIDTANGRVVVELYPEIAPKHVARVKELARAAFYDGLLFHRVIDGFMAQTGDPKGDGTGGSTMPDLPQEFEFRRGPEMPFVSAAERSGEREGFYKTLPIVTQPDQLMRILQDGRVRAYGKHCPGVASMARSTEPDSANSQFFLMRAAYPSLDRRYTIWGRVVWNLDAVKKISVGEPPPSPDRMLAVRVAADLPEAERAPIYVLRTDSPAFAQLIQDVRTKRGADFSVCDVEVPARVPNDPGREAQRNRSWWKVIPFL